LRDWTDRTAQGWETYGGRAGDRPSVVWQEGQPMEFLQQTVRVSQSGQDESMGIEANKRGYLSAAGGG
jgi:hypothetical protein